MATIRQAFNEAVERGNKPFKIHFISFPFKLNLNAIRMISVSFAINLIISNETNVLHSEIFSCTNFPFSFFIFTSCTPVCLPRLNVQ